MHVFGFPLDLNWFLQFIVTAFLIALGLLHLVKNTASKYFMVDANFEPPSAHRSPAVADAGGDSCVVCGNSTKKQCSGCKAVKYCSEACQRSHWSSGHKTKCKDLKLSGKANLVQSASLQCGRRFSSAVALVPACRTNHVIKQSKEVLFPYEEFVELFNRDKPGFPPCGLLNCGNSCFANVVLQCLMYTRPLVAYLLEKGHRGECRRNDWCFLCEFQTHVVRASESRQPFSPINILSRLPNIGGNLGYGKQEDAHEFMRFAIDTMQSVCLDEYGGEKEVDARTQETTLIQHIFGGHLQSQVICTKCNNISNQYENMMDLTVEIHGDAASLEECLNQFTVRERLHGDNMYKCDGCNDYVMAWKRLTVRKAPNILTIALKRFQSGRFGKLNKRVTFPETLDLNPYMSEEGDGDNVYKLYAVIVHVDMLNASFFGHYICYTKDFYGNWYRIDDCKVARVDLEEVLSQGAYMLMYSRVCARPSCLKAVESLGKDQQTVKIVQGGGRYAKESVECSTVAGPIDSICMSGSLAPDSNSHSRVCSSEKKSPSFTNSEYVEEDMEILGPESSSAVSEDVEVHGNGYLNATEETASPVVDVDRLFSGDGSSLSEKFEPEAYSLNYKLTSSNYGVGGKNRAVNGAKEMTSSSSRSSLPKENGVCLGVETSRDGSVSGLSLDGDLNEDNPVDSKDHQQKMENKKGLPSACSSKDAEGKLAGRNSSGTKPKPLFPPGFLGRRSSNKSMKRGARTMSEAGDFVSCNHKKGDSGFQEPGCHHQNGARTQEVGNPHLEGNTSLPFTSGEEVGNYLDKDMAAHSKSGEFTNLCSGESATVINDNKEINNIDRDGQPLIEKTPRAIVRSSMSETTRSDLVGTDVERL